MTNHRTKNVLATDRRRIAWLVALGILLLCPHEADSQTAIELRIRRDGTELEVVWPAGLKDSLETTVYPTFEIQRSEDLRHWEPPQDGLRDNSAGLKALLRYAFPPDRPHAFFRVMGRLQTYHAAASGAEVFGYAAAFTQELSALGQISPEEFAASYRSSAEYLPAITFDPTQAAHWDLFDRNADFKLSEAELAILRRNGFVVSERLGWPSFGDAFYSIWKNDLPVFVSADALLHAWHRSYIALLQETELIYLLKTFQDILAAMAQQIPAVQAQYGQSHWADAILDADYYLAVARSLLHREHIPTRLNQDDRVTETLEAVANEELQNFELFGRDRVVDFSQFKVRGHYEEFPSLHGYFQGMMWCGRIDLRVAGNPDESSLRELASAVILRHLLQASARFGLWENFDRVLNAYVGWTDSMTFGQLNELLAANGVVGLDSLPEEAALVQLREAIESTDLGQQAIRSHYFKSPLGAAQIQLPRSFTVFGQKFIPDSWALAKVVFDDIIWDGNGIPEYSDKVQRRVPSGLDVAFSVLGNSQIVPELVARINAVDGHRWRDGKPYQHNLAAVRNVIDRQTAATWSDNIYVSWLDCLRALSQPTTGPEYPEAMRTHAWAMKTLNTQLASWSQLRHDTILYAKQSYTGGGGCEYPAGYVEPAPRFWNRLGKMASLTGDLLAELPVDGVTEVTGREREETYPIDLQKWKAGQQEFLRNFAATVERLEAMANKELNEAVFTQEETQFLEDWINRESFGSRGPPRYDGWYPRLFYYSNRPFKILEGDLTTHDVERWDAIVADVHTDVPYREIGDLGSVLHEGVGNVNLLMIAVDCGEDRAVYAGPVLSHYEFETGPGVVRKSDSEWQADHETSKIPSPPKWTDGYLVRSR